MGWWTPIVREVSRRAMKDPKVQKMAKEAGQKMAQAASAAQLQSKLSEATRHANQWKHTVAQNIPKNIKDQYHQFKAKSGGASSSSGKAAGGGASRPHHESYGGGGGSASSSGSGGGGGNKWWHRFKNISMDDVKAKVLPFLAANFMGVMFVFQFGHQIWMLVVGLVTELIKQRQIEKKKQEAEQKRLMREQETSTLQQRQIEERQKKKAELESAHGGLASFFVSGDQQKDLEEANDGNGQSLHAIDLAMQEEEQRRMGAMQNMTRRERRAYEKASNKKKRTQQQQQPQEVLHFESENDGDDGSASSRRSDDSDNEMEDSYRSRSSLDDDSSSFTSSREDSSSSSTAGSSLGQQVLHKKDPAALQKELQQQGGFMYSVGNNTTVAANQVNENDPNYTYLMANLSAAQQQQQYLPSFISGLGGNNGRGPVASENTYDPLSWDRTSAWNVGEKFNAAQRDPLRETKFW